MENLYWQMWSMAINGFEQLKAELFYVFVRDGSLCFINNKERIPINSRLFFTRW